LIKELSLLLAGKSSALGPLVLEVVVATGFLLPVVYYFSKFFFDSKSARVVFMLVPLIYVGLFLADSQIGFLPFFPDSAEFRLALETPPSKLEEEFGSVHRSFSWLNAPIRFFGGTAISFVVLSSVMFALGAALVWRAWVQFSNYKFDETHHIVFMIVVVFWPSSLIYIPAILREGQVLFFWGLFMYSAVLLTNSIQWIGGWTCVSIAIGGTLLMREELIPVMLIFIGVLIGIDRINENGLIYTLSIGVATISSLFLVMSTFSLQYLISPDQLADVRNARVNNYSSSSTYMGDVQWQSWLDVITDSIPLTIKFLLSPLSINHSLKWFVPTLDAMFVLFVIVLVGFWTTKSALQDRHESVIWVFATVIIAFGFGLVEFHATGAVRHRMPVILLLIPIASTACGEYILKRFRIIR
jgi:hypothetical protein